MLLYIVSVLVKYKNLKKDLKNICKQFIICHMLFIKKSFYYFSVQILLFQAFFQLIYLNLQISQLSLPFVHRIFIRLKSKYLLNYQFFDIKSVDTFAVD